MTREQAMRILLDKFHKSYLNGSNGSTLTAISVFLTWLYKHGWTVMSREELKRLEIIFRAEREDKHVKGL